MSFYNGSSTRLVHAGESRPKPHHAIATPIFQTSTFTNTADLVAFMEAETHGEETTRLEYGRYGNPTVAAVESKLAALDGGEAALLFSSGMAAVTLTLLTLLSTDTHLVCTDDCYHRTRQFITKFMDRYSVEATQVPMGDYEALEATIRPATRLIFSESPTNPRLFELDADPETTGRFVDALQIPYIGPSFGGVEGLVESVALSGYYELSSQERAAIGISDSLVRLAVGVESINDLTADLGQALERVFGAVTKEGKSQEVPAVFEKILTHKEMQDE